HHPGGSGKCIACAVMLKTISARRRIGVTPEVREDKHGGLSRVLRFALDHLPDLSTQPIGTLNRVDVQRVRAGMRYIDIVWCDPEQARSKLAHQLTRDIYGKLIRAPQAAGVRSKVCHRNLEHFRHLLELL